MTQDGYFSKKQLQKINLDPQYKFQNLQHLYFANYVFYRYKKYIKGLNVKNIEIYTTLDKNLQKKLNNSIQKNLSDHINVAGISLDKSGNIVAMVGGKKYQESSFNIALMAKDKLDPFLKLLFF